MLLPNTLFRSGCAAIVLTTHRARHNKYLLRELVRTHAGARAGAFDAILQTVDEEGLTGVCLSK